MDFTKKNPLKKPLLATGDPKYDDPPSFWPCCPLASQKPEGGGPGGGLIWCCPLHGDEIMGRTTVEHEIEFLKLVAECLSPEAKRRLNMDAPRVVTA